MNHLAKLATAVALAAGVLAPAAPAQANQPIDNEIPTVKQGSSVVIRDDASDGFANATLRVKRPAAINYNGGDQLVCLGDGSTDIRIDTSAGAAMGLQVFDPVSGAWGTTGTIVGTTCSYPDPGDGSGPTNVWYDFDIRGDHYGDVDNAIVVTLLRDGERATNGPVTSFDAVVDVRIPEAISLTATDIDLSQSDGMIEVLMTREDWLGCDSSLDRGIALFPDANSIGLVSVVDFDHDFVATPPGGFQFTYTNVADQRLAPACGNSIPLRIAATSAGVVPSTLQLVDVAADTLVSQIKQDITVTGTLNKTAPVVTINAPADGVTYQVGSVPAVDVVCDDDPASLENSDNACLVSGYSDQLGTHTMTVSSRSWGGITTESVTYTVADIPVDETAPVVTIEGVADGATYEAGSVPAASCSAVDDVEGAMACDLTGFSDQVGMHTVTGTATDAAGNVGTASATYSVVDTTPPSDFGPGFGGPIDAPPALNTGKANRAFPIFFNVFQDGVEITDPARIDLSINSISCGWFTSLEEDEVEYSYSTPVDLAYVDGQFKAKLQIGKDGAGCYVLTASVVDGSGSASAYFELS